MALQYTEAAFRLKSILGSRHLTDAEFIKGGYMVFDTISSRDAAPPYTGDDADGSKDGVILVGSFCYVQATSKFYYCSAIDTTNRTATWSEFLASGSTNYFSFVYLNDEYDPTLTLVGDNVNIALRSLVPVFFMGSNLGSGVIFKRAFFAGTQNRYYYYVLFPDATKLGDTWINGAIFKSDSASTPSNLTFVSWSQPNSITQIQEALATSLPTIQWEDDATVEISGLSITNNFS